MRRLLLLRHAKTETGKPNRDHERALTARGRANAAALGAWLQHNGFAPDLVLCSAAARTVETWEIASQELDLVPQTEFLEQLYLAPAKRIQAIIHAAGDAATILVIGHNPGMEDCAAELSRKPRDKGEAARREDLSEKFPTCGLAVLAFEDAVAPGAGALIEFITPKDLA